LRWSQKGAAMIRVVATAVALACALAQSVAAAAQSYQPGVFVATPHGPIELTAFAEVMRSGQLQMAKGSLENVPTVTEFLGILCNVPNWRPGGVMIANKAIFRDERAERREVPYALRMKNISAFEVRVENVERRDRLAQLIRDVRASDEDPAYVFIVMASNGLNRLYPFRVKIE
jgi:hypothetical protein